MPPTLTAVALDRLLEHGAPKSIPKPLNTKPDSRTEKRTHLPQISPTLYATPVPTPLPDSPSSFPPSPYIVNHKRRGPRLLKSFVQDDVSLQQQGTEEMKVDTNGNNMDIEVVETTSAKEVVVNGFRDGEPGNRNLNDGLGVTEDSSKVGATVDGRDECEDFFDPQESMSFTSNIDEEDTRGTERPLKLTTPMGEFYDAWDGNYSFSSLVSIVFHPHYLVPRGKNEREKVLISAWQYLKNRNTCLCHTGPCCKH
uniref:Uncharacterized protein n=1 Tax=Nelumbo nucifera TaxID=4432 RepID=A0A822Z887_NELNU|nr:TPA_asm: hypothetical protein HUJ06_015096 [Nelumbo nucifera]